MVFETPAWWILLALLAYMAVGALWYSPMLFAKAWAKLVKPKGPMAGSGPAMAITVAAELIIVVALAYLVGALDILGPVEGAMFGALMCLCFAATTALINRTFQGLNLRLYLIDMGYHLIGMSLAGAIVTL